MKKYLTVTEACNYLLQNTVKGVSYNSATSEMTITYNDEDRLVTETFVIGGGGLTPEEKQEIEDMKNLLDNTVEVLNDTLSLTSNNIHSNVEIDSSLICNINSNSADDVIQWSPVPASMSDCADCGLYALERDASDLENGTLKFAKLNNDYNLSLNPIYINIVVLKQNNIE